MSFANEIEDWDLLAQVCQAYRTLSDRLIDEIAMHRAQATLLCKLFEQDGSTQTEIANQLGIQGATVTNMLQRMEEAGLVTRERDPEDNRLVRVYLTQAGSEKERAITEQFLKVEATIYTGFSSEERAILRMLLRRILQNMNTA
jgi:MarR family transcriptional regulator, organic hydroperoxide resistance regulator